MQRAILMPPVLPGAALAELKHWLAITSDRDDAALQALLAAALETCAAFTGAVPLETVFEEMHPAHGEWQRLGLAPVRAVAGVANIAADGSARVELAPASYRVEIGFDGSARFRVAGPIDARSLVAVRYVAGQAQSWEALPAAVRQGVVRLAAHWFQDRDSASGAHAPPAAVTALWQPLRRRRLA